MNKKKDYYSLARGVGEFNIPPEILLRQAEGTAKSEAKDAKEE